jgi:DNA-binding NarL/FixJ family response regulator
LELRHLSSANRIRVEDRPGACHAPVESSNKGFDAGGAAVFSQSVANHVLTTFSTGKRPDAEAVFPELTQRERDILELIAQGYPNPRIAHTLGLSPKTVGNYVSTIFAKLHVVDRADAIIRAREAGMGRAERRT